MRAQYDQKTHGFRTVRERDGLGYICSCSESHYQDAITTEAEVHLSREYVRENLHEIESIDTFDHAEYDHEAGSWRVIP